MVDGVNFVNSVNSGLSNLHIDNQNQHVERRGRPLHHPSIRNKSATVARKYIILQMISQSNFNTGVVNDIIFYCDVPETFSSPDYEDRNVFRGRMLDTVNVSRDSTFHSWVLALGYIVSMSRNSDLFVQYDVVVPAQLDITLRVTRIRGLREKDIIDSITEDHLCDINLPDIDFLREYFWNNVECALVENIL